MDSDGVTAYFQRLYGGLMEAEPEARPILRRFFFAYATRDWATEVPEALEQAVPAMSAMHRALELGEYAEALVYLKVWAALLGVSAGDAAPG